jgi:hypothetical protein
MVMAIEAEKDLEMIELDVKTVFFYGKLEEEIYRKQPEGFMIPGNEEEVCRLVKSINVKLLILAGLPRLKRQI